MKLFLILCMNLFSFFFSRAQDNDISLEKIRSIDVDLCVKIINEDYFQKDLLEFPSSDYLIGMKGYYLHFNESIESSKLFLESKLSQFPNLSRCTFYNLAKAVNSTNESEKISSLKKSLALDTKGINNWTLLELFYYFRDKRNFSEATKYIDKLYKNSPSFPLVIVEKINMGIEQNNLIAAKIMAKKLIEEIPSYIIPKLQLGEICQLEGSFEESKIAFEDVLSIDSINIDALVGLGYSYQYLKNNNEVAIDYYLKAYDLNKENSTTSKRVGIAYINLKNFDLAKKFLVESYNLKNEYETSVELIYALIQLSEYDSAQDIITKSIDVHGLDYRIAFFEILLLHFEGDKDKVQEKLGNFYRDFPLEVEWLSLQAKNWNIEFIKKK